MLIWSLPPQIESSARLLMHTGSMPGFCCVAAARYISIVNFITPELVLDCMRPYADIVSPSRRVCVAWHFDATSSATNNIVGSGSRRKGWQAWQRIFTPSNRPGRPIPPPADAVRLRLFEPGDLPAAHAMSSALKWPHRIEDWQFALSLGQGVVAERDGKVLGTALSWNLGRTTPPSAW